MKFVLDNGLVHIVENHGLANNKIEGSVEAPGLDGFTLFCSINGREYKKLQGKLVVPKEDVKKSSLHLKFKATKPQKSTLFFESDKMPLTHAIILGGKLEDRYPIALKNVLKEMKKLKKELKSNMIDLVDTFEQITKKGNLF